MAHYKNREAEQQEDSHLKEVRIHELEMLVEDEKSNSENLEKKLQKRVEMLKEVQTTN